MRFKSHKISTFWSHSWHGGQLKKILTLLTYNGYAAPLGGFLVAISMMILFDFDLLPGLDRGSRVALHFQCGVCVPVSS